MSSERTPIVAANWKMNKTPAEAEQFLTAFFPSLSTIGTAEVLVCPSFLALERSVELCAGTGIGVAAQNMHEAEAGAYTGEVSAAMLVDAGLTGVILGHSERRRLFGETDAALATKLAVALDAELLPILCVGESEAERDREQTEDILRRQLEEDLSAVPDERLAEVVIAYEPIWAIGTGRTATADQADEACAFIRSLVAERDQGAAESIRIQYGGSVKPDNARELLGRENIDGALVGGAALEADSFAQIAAAAG